MGSLQEFSGWAVGVAMSLLSSLLSSLGLNLQRKFHFDNHHLAVMDRVSCWESRTWAIGIGLYLFSQTFSSVALGVY